LPKIEEALANGWGKVLRVFLRFYSRGRLCYTSLGAAETPGPIHHTIHAANNFYPGTMFTTSA
jgi:hypothetical protein